jgi:4a-hydroxytetrahydrobiopterin dehydratase
VATAAASIPDMTDTIRPSDFLQATGAEDWRIISDGACAFFRTSSLGESARFVAGISDGTGLGERSFGIDVRHDGVTVRTVTMRGDLFGLSAADLDVARRVSAIARDMGLQADPSHIQGLLVIPGAPDINAIMPFWQAVLGYVPRPDSPDEDLVDPSDRNAPFWLERMDEPRGDGLGTIHVSVWLPYEEAQARIDAALAAGGRMVRDETAPAWWTLADPYGNEVCVSTISHRD